MSTMISMKMSASWEAEKSSSNAVPRLCNLSLVQIILDRPLEPDSSNTGFFVVVRMAGSARRVLRSPEITLISPKSGAQVNGLHPPCTSSDGSLSVCLTEPNLSTSGLTGLASTTPYSQAQPVVSTAMTTALGAAPASATTSAAAAVALSESASCGAGGCVPIDFNCSIQYSHMLNRDANTLQILLQRRKKYKSKTMNLGYKTLAYCNVNLAQVLQRRIENRFLELYTDPKCSTRPIGRVEVQCLSTSPIEKDLMNGKRKVVDEDEDFPLPDMYSEDSDHADESDEDQIAENEETGHSRQKKLVKAMSVGQKQIKQKLIGLLKKLKIGDPNEEDLDAAETSKLWDEFDLIATASDIEEEDSEAEGTDTVSIHSTPRPTLRPFFATTGSSDDTLSADAGTKLLKRLQRELFARGETETSPDAVYLHSVLPAASLDPRSTRFARSTKKESGHAVCSAGTANSSVGFQASGTARTNSSVLRHHRGNGNSGGVLASGRLASRFVHMRRRSNLGESSKHSSAVTESRFHGNPLTSNSIDGSVSGSAVAAGLPGSPTNNDSSDENGQVNGVAVDAVAGTSTTLISPRSSIPTLQTDATAVTATSLADAALGTNSAQMLTPNPTRAPSSNSPTLTSTPEAHRHHTSFGRASDAREFSFTNLDDSQLEADQLHPGTLDQIGNVVFLLHTAEPGWKIASDLFSGRDLRLVPISSYAEVKQTLARLASDAQSQKWRASDGDLIKVCLLGGDSLISLALRAYVDQLSSRSAELAAAFRFYVIPLSGLVSQQCCPAPIMSPTSSGTGQIPRSRVQPTAASSVRTSFPARPLSEAVNSSFASEAWSDTDNAGKAGSSIPWIGPHLDSSNMLACHLCRLDPSYASLFSELCSPRPFRSGSIATDQCSRTRTAAGESGLSTDSRTGPGSSSSEGSPVPRSLDLFERVLVYLNNSHSVLPMPIGVCLLGTASGTVGSGKAHKASHVTSEQTGTSSAVAGVLDMPTASSAVTGLNEEMLIPFLLTIRLGVDPSLLQSPGIAYPAQSHARSATGDPMMMTMMAAPGQPSHPADASAVVSDPEAPNAPNKRSMSPECGAQTALPSPNASFRSRRFRRSHSSTQQAMSHCSSPVTDTRFWDLQIEYWSVQPSTSTTTTNTTTTPTLAGSVAVGSVSGFTKSGLPTGESQFGSSLNTSPHSTSAESTQPPRRCTMKSICRGLVVTLAHPTAAVTRGGDYGYSGPELTPGYTRPSILLSSTTASGSGQPHGLTLAIWTKEKKQKIMRIGRRGKEFGCKFEVVEGIQRLLCTGRGCVGGSSTGGSVERSRDSEVTTGCPDVGGLALESVAPPTKLPALGLSIGGTGSGLGSSGASSSSSSSAGSSMMQVTIDGVEWAGLKFFQVTPSWRTHIKSFPVGTMSVGRTDQPQTTNATGPPLSVPVLL